MTDLNLNQIQEQLNELFVSYGERRLVFWFDAEKDFEEDIDSDGIELKNAQIKKIESNTQFSTKRFLELEDTTTNYLIYSPFEKINDNDENNHLLSIIKYSEVFIADRISLVMKQLDIPQTLHDVMTQYNKFFAAKTRIASFQKMINAPIQNKEELELTMMAVLTKSNTNQFYSIVQSLLVEYSNEKDDFFNQLINYDLEESFWKYILNYYGYNSEQPTIQKLIISFFSNGFYGQLGYQKLPNSLKEYEVVEQTTAIVSFMDGVMNDSRYSKTFDFLSQQTYQLINGTKLLENASVEDLIEADIFEMIHLKIISYYIKQLLSGDITPVVSGMSLGEVTTKKIRAHFGEKYAHQYNVLLNAQKILTFAYQVNINEFNDIYKDYETLTYKIDQYYRKFIWHLDSFEMTEEFYELYQLIERKYKVFLDETSRLWNELLNIEMKPSMLNFYDTYVHENMKTVVIISDALRYEAVKEIQVVIQNEKKYSTKMNTVLAVLPSVTEFGKAASLCRRSDKLEFIDGTNVTINGMSTKGTLARDKILKEKNSKSLAITYEDVIAKDNAKELRELFNGKEVIYLYHDQIDRAGDHGQESQVFNAVEKTIDELKNLIPRISNGANVYRFIITSDHGFLYTRSDVEEFDKIDNPSISSEDRVERRFIISKNNYNNIGISSIELGKSLKNSDERIVYFPTTSSIFKKAGGGQNYVHGGSSPQEMIVPVLEINVSRGSSSKEVVQVQLMTANRKIIGLSKVLEFYQTDAVNDSIVKANYSLYFEESKGNMISNAHSYYADSTATTAAERFTNFTFDFINRNYDTNEKVYLILKNMDTHIEIERIEFLIDNPFAGDHNFDI